MLEESEESKPREILFKMKELVRKELEHLIILNSHSLEI